MQTFLPEPDFLLTSKTLDKKRLFKQVVEARQILTLLDEKIHKTEDGFVLIYEFLKKSKQHKNHPVLKMWRNHIDFLKLYHDFMLYECLQRGIKTAPYFLIDGRYESLCELFAAHLYAKNIPSWFGNKKFHDSHKSNLVRKLPEHYRKFYPDIIDDLPYIWPEE